MKRERREAPKYRAPRGRPATWTAEECEAAARHLAETFTLAKLRRNQSVIRAQQVMAHRDGKAEASADLDVMDRYTARAVMLQQFPDEA